jgi:AcrR family transcriptional regulator
MANTYHHGNLRAALLEAASATLTEEGPDALTMRALAERVGVSRSAAYRHFDSKGAILAELASDGFRALGTILEEVERASDRTRLAEQGAAYVRFARAHPAAYQLMYGRYALDRTAHPHLREAAEAAYAVLVATIRRGQAEGILRDGPPEHLAYVTWSQLHGLAALLVDKQIKPPEDPDALARLAMDTLLDGLGA